MSEPIKPALTAEEWAEVRQYGGPRKYNTSFEGVDYEDGMRYLAAMALSESAPGYLPLFTWEDVDELREAIALEGDDDTEPAIWLDHLRARIGSVADRIAALLPPREP